MLVRHRITVRHFVTALYALTGAITYRSLQCGSAQHGAATLYDSNSGQNGSVWYYSTTCLTGVGT